MERHRVNLNGYLEAKEANPKRLRIVGLQLYDISGKGKAKEMVKRSELPGVWEGGGMNK